ncbi:MAG: alpha/beta hydrolase [Actinomycetota bacterium]|jgi:pimeloyl-ACP methyl ester carboxylesterase|nr:alpha/beta hydrolase [Actinomycetota bacterium]
MAMHEPRSDDNGFRPPILGVLAGATATAALLWRARRKPKLEGRIQWSPPAGRLGDAGLAVRTHGVGRPATVLLHGMFASARYWGASYDELGREATLVVPDLAGFGRSVNVEVDGYGPDEHADLVARTLHELGVADQPVVVAAHSLGVLVGLRLAARHPGLVGGIVGFAPPLFPDSAAARRRLGQAHVLLGLFVLNSRLAESVCDWMCRHRQFAAWLGRLIRPDLPAPLAEDRLEHTYASYAESLAKVVLAAGVAASVEDLDVPVHLVAGGRDTIVDRDFLDTLASDHSHVTLSVWEGDEHEIPLTQPATCVAEIKKLRAVVAHNSPDAPS